VCQEVGEERRNKGGLAGARRCLHDCRSAGAAQRFGQGGEGISKRQPCTDGLEIEGRGG
jgi:hypothetical protein